MTTELIHRCGVCRCYMDHQDLFCANCGTENPMADEASKQLGHATNHHSFDCTSCGASMSYDASVQALRCPFCGSQAMEKRRAAQSIQPDGVVRFGIDGARAETILRSWLGSGFWRPANASRAARIGEMTAVFVPYWVFEASTDTRWTADSSPAPFGSRGDWYPLSGQRTDQHKGILIAGSSILSRHETDSIAPFDISAGMPAERMDLKNAIFEEFRVPRKLARPLARGAIEELERQACAGLVPNRHRKVQVNVRISGMRGAPILLPVWILAYRYKGQIHRVLVNGQTGKIAGSAPFSYGKLGVVVLVVLTVIVTIAVLASLS